MIVPATPTALRLELAFWQTRLNGGRALGHSRDRDVTAFGRRLVNGVHDLKDMMPEPGVDAGFATIAQRRGHLRDSQPATALRVSERDVPPLRLATALHFDTAAEDVRIGHREGPFRTVYLDGPMKPGRPYVEAGDDRPDCAVFEVQHPRHVSRNLDSDRLSASRLALDGPFGQVRASRTGDPLDRSHQVHKRGQVVRSHVKHRSAALLVIERGVRVPVLVPMVEHKRGGGDRLADCAVVDKFAARLKPAAEERIRGAAERDALLPGSLKDERGVLDLDRKRFLVVDVFAGRDDGQAHVGMGLWDREVEDDLDVGAGEKLVDGQHLRHSELGCSALGLGHVDIRARQDLDAGHPRQVGQVLAADDATTDDAYAHRGRLDWFAHRVILRISGL